MTDLLILAAFIAVMALLVAVVVTTPSGAWPRYVRGRRYHRAGLARHTEAWLNAHNRVEADRVGNLLLAALETAPDVSVSPFAARTA